MKKNEFNLEDKEIYKLFNGIKVEESEFEDKVEEVSTIQKERIKKNLNKRMKGREILKKLKYGVTAASIGVVCVIGVGITNPSLAKNVPVLNSVIQILSSKHEPDAKYEIYSQMIGESVKSKGITITINEVLADESKLIIGYTIKSDKKIENLHGITFSILEGMKINRQRFNGGATALKGEHIDEYTYVGATELNLTFAEVWKKNDVNSNVSEKINIDLKIRNVMDVKGKWDFAFSVSKDEIFKDTTIFKPNKKVDFPDSTISIDEVIFTPIGTYISTSGVYKEGERDKINASMFEGSRWMIFDDNGVELISRSFGWISDDGINFNGEGNFYKLKDIPKYLTVIPYIDHDANDAYLKSLNGNKGSLGTRTNRRIKSIDGIYPIEIVQGKIGKVIINDIKIEEDRTIVNYSSEGKIPYNECENLYIKDEDGNYIEEKESGIIRKDEKKPNEYIKVFEPLDSNKKYTVFMNNLNNFEIREDLKFNIDLK